MPSTGLNFPKEEGENLSVKSPHFFCFLAKPRTGTRHHPCAMSPVATLFWGPGHPWGAGPTSLPNSSSPCPPSLAAGCRPSRADGLWLPGGSQGRKQMRPPWCPAHNWDPAAWGGHLHNKDNLVPKLSPEVNCLDLGTVNKFHFFFPMFCQAN